MREPGVEHVPALVSQRRAQVGIRLLVGDDHSALARRHLFIRVEGEARQVAECADALSLVLGAERLAGVFDQMKSFLSGDLDDRGHVGRLTEGMNRQNALERVWSRRIPKRWRQPRAAVP